MHFYWLLLLLLAGCTSVPDKVTPVSPFELERYLGTWHEIARLDHSNVRPIWLKPNVLALPWIS